MSSQGQDPLKAQDTLGTKKEAEKDEGKKDHHIPSTMLWNQTLNKTFQSNNHSLKGVRSPLRRFTKYFGVTPEEMLGKAPTPQEMLYYCAENGLMEGMIAAISQGASLTAPCKEGKTGLDYAAIGGHPSVTRYIFVQTYLKRKVPVGFDGSLGV